MSEDKPRADKVRYDDFEFNLDDPRDRTLLEFVERIGERSRKRQEAEKSDETDAE